MQKEEYLIKNACYSLTKYYLCKQNNKRSLLGRKQRNQVTRSFPNRYQFSCINNVTYLFSIRYTLINILECERKRVAWTFSHNRWGVGAMLRLMRRRESKTKAEPEKTSAARLVMLFAFCRCC